MQKRRKQEIFDDSFYKLAGEITKVLEKNKDGTDQKQQVEELLDAERNSKKSSSNTDKALKSISNSYKRYVSKTRIYLARDLTLEKQQQHFHPKSLLLLRQGIQTISSNLISTTNSLDSLETTGEDPSQNEQKNSTSEFTKRVKS